MEAAAAGLGAMTGMAAMAAFAWASMELPFTGWTIPVEPLLVPLRNRPDFEANAARLAENAS